ncbi:MAG: hypothetical protein HRT68_03300 [Flavobacteriaceae bacterium]|nr:hypothetical protein [Flavobacteriaceae bacterium]
MSKQHFKFIVLLISLGTTDYSFAQAKKPNQAHISGELLLDQTWDRTLYLSHIPSFENMYDMSNEMIIAKTKIDSLGYFQFNLDFFPKEENLFRLHVTKKGDTPATLIIGGKDENHTFLIANKDSNIELRANSLNPPFRKVLYKKHSVNALFQEVTDFVYSLDSLAAESTSAKRSFIDDNKNKELLVVADTSTNVLVSLYAIYNSKYESDYFSNPNFFSLYSEKRKDEDHSYMKTFRSKFDLPKPERDNTLILVIIGVALCGLAYLFGKYGFKKKSGYEKLTVQERKIFELLRNGATNQDIANTYNIGLSTVKSHVSSIYSKLNIKSRKEVIDFKV